MAELYAFVDESERRGRYLMCSVVIEPARRSELRRALRQFLQPGQHQLHFKKASPRRRRELATRLAALDVDASVFICRATAERGEAEARAVCLHAIIDDLQSRGPDIRLYLESRHHQDRDDHGVVDRARRPVPALTYEHLPGVQDPLLWIPDAFAWLVGAGGECSRRAGSSLAKVVEVG